MKTMIDQKRENTMKIEAGKDEKRERERKREREKEREREISIAISR